MYRYVRKGPLCIVLQFIEMEHCVLCIGMYGKSHCLFYCSLLKSNDVLNLENACEYFAIKSLLVVSQVPPLDFIRCFKVLL